MAAPLALVCDHLFAKDVKDRQDVRVLLHDAARGMTADIVHCIRHRRTLNMPDQYHGIQGDLKREYVCLTRAKDRDVAGEAALWRPKL